MTRITFFCDFNHRSSNGFPVSKIIAFSPRMQQACNPHAKGGSLFKDVEHLLRLAAVMLIALVAFAVLRAAVVPKSFGQYGHYRGEAIAEIAARPVVHAGHEVCEGCHTEVVEQKQQSRHAGLHCEVCHGPQARHAEDPASVTPPKPDTAVICARCHEANAAKPKSFPQVVTANHSGGLACDTCHQPHRPRIEEQAKTTQGKTTMGARK